ncbi:hypothetical protein ACIQ1D_18150 [Lysinibacillus xylanilyticus]|uniref:ATP-dependent DNA ligase n=1 Tax=Lysinibacillus xylanilyticus TaxID=582475 RepID=UPI0038233C4C
MLFTPIKPMLLGTGKEIIDNPETIWDIKWDGWLTLIHKEGERVEAYTREGNNITAKFPELQAVGQAIKEHTAIIDAEGVVLRSGVSVFEDFAYRGSLSNKEKIKPATLTHPANFVAFDILATDKQVMKQPLFEMNMEGIVGKRRDSIYKVNHRSSNDWL